MINYHQARAMVELDSISDILKLKYPEIADDMISWKSNHRCDCGKRFIDFLNIKYKEEKDKIFLDSILQNTDLINKAKEIEKKFSEDHQKRLFSGKIIKIDKSPKSWEELSNTLQKNRAIFKSFYMIDQGDTFEVRFL